MLRHGAGGPAKFGVGRRRVLQQFHDQQAVALAEFETLMLVNDCLCFLQDRAQDEAGHVGLRQSDGPQKEQPLVVGEAELAHVQTEDECLRYCKEAYGDQYAMYAAALTGKTAEEFARHEAGRELFWDR